MSSSLESDSDGRYITVISWILGIAALAYVGHCYCGNILDQRAEKQADEKADVARESAVADLVKRTGADSGWKSRLVGGTSFRTTPILSVELESLWLQKPILVKGSIIDVASLDESHYRVTITEARFGTHFILGTRLHFSLIASKEKIGAFLKEHPRSVSQFDFMTTVAAVVLIKEIRRGAVSVEDGDAIELRIGEGELVEILYIGH